MYPSLDVSPPAASLAATAGSSAGAGAGGAGGARSFGGAATTTSLSGDGPLFPLLRVQVNSKLRVAPQVLIPAANESSPSPTAGDDVSVPRSNFAFDFDAERRAVEKAAKAADAAASAAAAATDAGGAAPSSSSSSSSTTPSPWTPPDPWSALFERHAEASREEVALAAAAAAAAAAAELAGAAGGEDRGRGQGGGVEKVEKSLEPLRQLTAMGFDPRQALGALVVSKGDLAAATDACLAAAAASGARI